MNNFQKLAQGLNVAPLLNAIMRSPELWDRDALRTTYPGTPHSQVGDIWLRFNDISDPNKVIDDIECINYPAWYDLPQARDIVFGLMRTVEGERLGRVLITRLRPGDKIDPHCDEGAPATYYDRYHVVLNSAPGCLFRAGQEMVNMATGEVWWFDNTLEHEVVNNSVDDRIHMIVDIRASK